jgi:hypothetical protein
MRGIYVVLTVQDVLGVGLPVVGDIRLLKTEEWLVQLFEHGDDVAADVVMALACKVG